MRIDPPRQQDNSIPLNSFAEETKSVDEPSIEWVRSPHSQWILALVSFGESVLLPIITDPFLVAIILADRARWIRYTVITIISSVVGGIAAYYLGALFFDVVGAWMVGVLSLEATFAEATVRLSDAGFWFVFLGAITPIPYKLVALASGFVFLPIWIFIAASLIGRTIRFAITGYLSYMFGPAAVELFRYRIHAVFYGLFAIGLLYMAWRLWM